MINIKNVFLNNMSVSHWIVKTSQICKNNMLKLYHDAVWYHLIHAPIKFHTSCPYR